MSYLAPTLTPPAGNPAVLAAAALQLGNLAASLDGVDTGGLSVADRLGFLTEARSGFVWTGDAADMFGTFIVDRFQAITSTGRRLMEAAAALAELAIALDEAQRQVAEAEELGRSLAASGPADVAPSFTGVSPLTYFSDVHLRAASANAAADQAKERAATQFRILTEAAPHYVAPTPKPKPAPKKNSFWGVAHVTLDLAGQIPVIGEPANLVDAGIYLAEGDKTNAAISASGAIPGVGNFTTGGRLAGRVATHVDDVAGVVRHSDDVPAPQVSRHLGGGGDAVPPVHGPGDAGHKWPKRDPNPQGGRRVVEPEPGTTNKDVDTEFLPGRDTDPTDVAERLRRAALLRQPDGGSAG